MPTLHTLITSKDQRPPSFGQGSVLKTTQSICPQCLSKIEATVLERNEQVWMDKSCPTHGAFSALLANDSRHFYLADPRVEALGSCCGPGRHCGDQTTNHSCNMLIEITEQCNLSCPTCYAGSSPEHTRMMSLSEFDALLQKLLNDGKGDADLIQLSGGEPTLNPDLFAMIEMALERGVRQIYVNTNGIKLAKRALAERLAAFGSRVCIYLQFDGFKSSTYKQLRGREDLLERKQAALAHCDALGITTVPVMTLTPGINDDEVAAFLNLSVQYPSAVSKVMIQPAMYSGRYENPRLVKRMTLADVAKSIVVQTDGVFCDDDFTPIPCSDPNCFSMALALRTPTGLFPVSRYFPRYDQWAQSEHADMISRVTDTFDSAEDIMAMLQFALGSDSVKKLSDSEVDSLLDQVASWQRAQQETPADNTGNGLFMIGIKPFMDAYTYDQDRIDKCCVHIISQAGEPVSFCEYNALRRPTGNL